VSWGWRVAFGLGVVLSLVILLVRRALAIAFFFAVGTAVGGISGPLLFAELVGTGKVGDTVVAFSIGATIMIVAGLVELILGVKAERQSLESIATPLTRCRHDDVTHCSGVGSSRSEAHRAGGDPLHRRARCP
jgi:hypothetical protein